MYFAIKINKIFTNNNFYIDAIITYRNKFSLINILNEVTTIN